MFENEIKGKNNIINDDNKNLELKISRKFTRNRKRPKRYPENSSNNIYVNYCRAYTPCTLEEALNSNDCKNWIKAIDKEIESLNKNKTWELVDKQQVKEILYIKWVYTRKSYNNYKASLFVRGFQQTNLIDIYAPIAKTQTLKIILSFFCQFGFIIEQMHTIHTMSVSMNI